MTILSPPPPSLPAMGGIHSRGPYAMQDGALHKAAAQQYALPEHAQGCNM